MSESGSEGGGARMRGRKRKRQVSWAAAELLEEVKLFHMAKPVNPSLPPPPVDDAGEGDEDDESTQPGVALLGLFGADATPGSSSSTPPHSGNPAGGSVASYGSIGDPPPTEWGGGAGFNDSRGLGIGVGGGSTAGGGLGGVKAAGSNSSLFKGFQKTETIVRRKKQATPPSAPPGSPPRPGEEGGVQQIHRYPKDIWPGHSSATQRADGNKLNGAGSGGPAGGAATEALEFFCDACDETIPTGTERMECAVCPDEFCLCHRCYDEAEVLDKRHEHELLPSAAPFHITRPAPSAEAAAAAAAALHVTEEAASQDSYDDDLG